MPEVVKAEYEGQPINIEDAEGDNLESLLACLAVARGCVGTEIERERECIQENVVSLECYTQVALRRSMRVKAAMVEHTLCENYKKHQTTSPAFKNLARLQEEQGFQMEQLVMNGANRSDVKLLVETHANQLRVASHAAELSLCSYAHQQRLEYSQALYAIYNRSKDITLGLSTPKETPEKPSKESTGRITSLVPTFGVGKLVKNVGTAGMSLVTGGLQKANILASDDSPKDSPPPSTPVSEHDVSTDVNGDTTNTLNLTVPATVGVVGLRGMSADVTVQLLNIKAAKRYLQYTSKGQSAQVVERSDTMNRIAKDQIGAWLVPISLDDLAKAARERTSRSPNWWVETAKDIEMVMPAHLLEGVSSSSELCFPSLQEGLAASLLEGGEKTPSSGNLLVTRHSNSPWCQMIVYLLYEPGSCFMEPLGRAMTMVQGVAQLFIDTTKISSLDMARGFLETAFRAKARLWLLTSSISKQTWPLHTASALREANSTHPPTSVVVSSSQLSNSLDFQTGLFSHFSPCPSSPTPSTAASR
eukprot:TRINITY_DN11232_c0_g1_i1.p1 TRINITY_DN11232_c0_g1~~TRINITY_DN11232_c0_g1_i1.p1  ORF type:complete len:532 (+),score=74.22 TRINITY_DN11232_c0_g1_i1:80-1675(+)